MLTKEQVKSFRSQYGIGGVSQTTFDIPDTTQDRLADVGQSVFSDIQGAISGTGQFEGESPVRRGTEATASAFSAVPRGALALAPEPVRTGVEKVGDFFGKGFKALTGTIAETKLFKEIGELEAQGFISPETTPEFYALKDKLGTASATGEIAGTIAGAEGAVATVQIAKQVGTALNQSRKALGNVVGTGARGIAETATQGLDAPSIMQRVSRTSKGRQDKFTKAAGQSQGEFLVERKIFGDIDQISEGLFKNFKRSKGSVDKALNKLDGNFKSTAIGQALKELVEREQSLSRTGVPSEKIGRVIELRKAHNGGGLSMSDINEVKRLYESNVKLDFIKENLPTKVESASQLDKAIRDFQFTKAKELGFKNLPELNRETRLSKQLMDDLGYESAGSAGNNAISLTDWLILAEATNNPAALATLVGKKAVSSKGVQSSIAEFLSRKDPAKASPKAVMEATVDSYLDFLKKNKNIQDTKLNVAQGKKISDASDDVLSQIEAQMLEIPDTGIQYNPDGTSFRTTSFPSFIPSTPKGIRSKARFERVVEHIRNGTNPPAHAGIDIELKEIVEKEMRDRKTRLVNNKPDELPDLADDGSF